MHREPAFPIPVFKVVRRMHDEDAWTVLRTASASEPRAGETNVGTDGREDLSTLLRTRAPFERAMAAAYADTVRRHRQANVPMAMWEDGRTVLVSPFDVRLPGEEDRPAAD